VVSSRDPGHRGRREPVRRVVPAPLIVWVASALAVTGLVWMHVRTSEVAAVDSWRERLATIADERARMLTTWVGERAMDTEVLSSTPIVRRVASLSSRHAQVSHATLKSLHEHLHRFARAYGYEDIALLGPDGSPIATLSGTPPSAAERAWALRAEPDEAPAIVLEDDGEGDALRLGRAVRDAGRTVAPRVVGAVVLTTRPLSAVDSLGSGTIEGTESGRISIAATAPAQGVDDGTIAAVEPALGARRWLVATISREEALAEAHATSLSLGLGAIAGIVLPALVIAIVWQRRRAAELGERLREKTALLEARAYTEAIVQSIDATVWEAELPKVDRDRAGDLERWRFTFVSKRVEAFLGRPATTWPGQVGLWLEHVDGADRDRVRALYSAVAAGRTTASVEFRVQRSDGTLVWLRDRVSASEVTGDEGSRMRGVLVDVTERVRAERSTMALLSVARDVGSARDRRDLLERVQRRAAEVLPCDGVITFLHDTKRDCLRAVAHHGLSRAAAERLARAEIRATDPLGRLLLAGEPVLANDLAAQPWLPRELAERYGIAAILAAPVRVRAHTAGVLVAGVVAPGRASFDHRQLALLDGIARQLAIGLEVSESHEVREEQARIAEALARVGQELVTATDPDEMLQGLCRLTNEVLECDTTHVVLPSASDDELVVVASAGDSAEERAATRALRLPVESIAPLLARVAHEPILRLVARAPGDNLARLPSAFGAEVVVCTALRRGSRPVGLLCAGYRQPDDASERHERIARGLGEIASTVFDRVQLVAELERASQVRSEFIATMSHELRTPLHIVMGYQEMLLDDAQGALTPEQRETLERCQRSARSLLDLVNATLDLARLESGRDAVDRGPVDVAGVVEPIVAELRSLVRQRSVDLVSDVARPLPTVTTDVVKLKVIVKNLVTNALKFTDAGSVTVRALGANGGVVIEVADTGIGIAPDALSFIFDPFRQAGPGDGPPRGGVGLGLHIVKRLADALGATVSVESSEGRGSTFRLSVPCSPPAPREDAA